MSSATVVIGAFRVNTTLDKVTKKYSYFSAKTYTTGTHLKGFTEVLLLSTHNIYFCAEIRKIFGYSSFLEL